MLRNFNQTSTLAIVLLMAVMTFCIGGCGADNVVACEDWIDEMSCGSTDFSALVDCNIYEETSCDIADYFGCLSDNTTCDEATGMTDTMGWASCASLALCD